MLDFVPNHTGLDHPWVNEHPEYYRGRFRARPRGGPRKTIPGSGAPKGDLLLAYGRDPYFSRLARHASAQLRQSGDCGSDDRRSGKNRRPVRWRALRHGDAGAGPTSSNARGDFSPNPSGRKQRNGFAKKSPGFCFMAEAYWDRRVDGSSNRDSTTRMTSGSTTVCANMHARPVREHFLAWYRLTRKSWPDSLRITMSRAGRRHLSRREYTKPRRSSRFCRRAFDSFTSGPVRRAEENAFSPHLGRAPNEPVDTALGRFYECLLAVLRQPVCARRAVGNCANAFPRGTATGRTTVSCGLRLAGPRRRAIAGPRSMTRPTRASAGCGSPSPGLSGKHWRLEDQLSPANYDRRRERVAVSGVYFWTCLAGHTHIFSLR